MKFKDLGTSPTSGGGGTFLKLADKESVVGVFRGQPHDLKQHWDGEKYVVCNESPDCPLCKSGNKAKFSFRINFIMSENGAHVAKVFQSGRLVYEALKALQDAGYDLEKTTVRMTRKGEKLNTEYEIVPIPNGVLTPAAEKKIAAVQLNDLSGAQQTAPDSFADATDEEVPF